jgi:AcrR family transcriptional regulator
MPRRRPADRLDQLIVAAARVFTAKGYRRAQMADVAREMGVAPGTLYLYVEGKEALFDLVVQRAFVDGEAPPPALPVPTPAPEAVLASLRKRARHEAATPVLDAALARRRPRDIDAELRAIAREHYGNLARSRRAVKLLERSALDWPELAAVWVGEIRHEIIRKLTAYVERRVRQGLLRPLPSVDAAARLLLETTAWFALHRHGDLEPPAVDEELIEETVVDFIVHGFTRRSS